MTFVQLLIAGIVIAGVVMIGLLAIIPALLEYPEGRDKNESELPPPTPGVAQGSDWPPPWEPPE